MDKWILMEYVDMQEEIKDIRKRIDKLKKEIDGLEIVSDSVQGTKRDGTFGSIRISGYPTPVYFKKQSKVKALSALLEEKEVELLELTLKAEEYIQTMRKSELRIMFRMYFLDNLSYPKVAIRMNGMFPYRKIPYTDENIKKRIQRYFEKVPHCPETKC